MPNEFGQKWALALIWHAKKCQNEFGPRRTSRNMFLFIQIQALRTSSKIASQMERS